MNIFRKLRDLAMAPEHPDPEAGLFGHKGAQTAPAKPGRQGFRRNAGPAQKLSEDALKLLMLHLLAQQPRNGFGILKAAKATAGGALPLNPNKLYPAVAALEAAGDISGSGSLPKRIFSITPAGRAALAAQQTELEALLAANPRPGNQAAPVRNALQGLRQTIRRKLGGRPPTPALARKIAALLNEAARSIDEL